MEECIFCKIIRGEIPALKVHEDEKTIAILDINPANYGHVLVIPKKHSANIYDIPVEDLKAVIAVAKEMAMKQKENLAAEGVNIIQNNGKIAGQIVEHFHLHVIPRFQGDKVYIGYERIQPTPEKMKETMEKLMSSPKQEEPKEDVPPEEKFGI